jgi:hypothetical protein
MNWKFMIACTFGLLVGLSIAPFEHRAVIASAAAPTDARFLIQNATADEPNGQGEDVPTHEVFLLDTQSGKVWKFQGLVWGKDKDGTMKVFSEPRFIAIDVDAPK